MEDTEGGEPGRAGLVNNPGRHPVAFVPKPTKVAELQVGERCADKALIRLRSPEATANPAPDTGTRPPDSGGIANP